MHILFLSTWFPYPPDNGSKLRVYYLLKVLAQKHQVTLVSFDFGTSRPQDAIDLNRWCSAVHTLPINPFQFNQTSALRTFFSLQPVAFRPVNAMKALVAEITSKTSFDVIVASTQVMSTYALQADPLIPKLFEEHNSMSRIAYERYVQAKTVQSKIRHWLSWQKIQRHEMKLFSKFHAITMVSEEDCQTTRQLLASEQNPVFLIPNGVDCDYNRPELVNPQPATLVYNGSLTYHANYDAMQWFLAEIFPQIKQHLSGVTLTITGTIAGINTSGLALDEAVKLTGHVDDIRIPITRSQVCVAPIRQGGGTRLKILEAMALGVPIVATSKAVEGLAAQPGTHYLHADTADSFAAAVISLLTSAELRVQLATNARELVVRMYNWQEISGRYTQLVEDVVKNARKDNQNVKQGA
ncbi:MAG: glycosyltransferase family 4 protein [Anaerolineae bacterium]